jgi:HTH-type transcriptional regulator/antitoxin HigA
MKQLGYKQKDLAEVIGLKRRVSENLNRKRKLTLEMIPQLAEIQGIPTEVLVNEYQPLTHAQRKAIIRWFYRKFGYV